MTYIVFLTLNKESNKGYIGITEKTDKFDGYIGNRINIFEPGTYNKSKTHLAQQVCRYGKNSFIRFTLKECDSYKEAVALKNYLVDENFIKRTDTLNMIGGHLSPLEAKPIYQFDLQGNLIKEWTDVSDDRIYLAIVDKVSFGNSYWSYDKTINVNLYQPHLLSEIIQYNRDGHALNRFDSVYQAAYALDIARDAITRAVFNRTTCHGYYFLRSVEDIQDIIGEKSAKKMVEKTKVYQYTKDGDYIREFDSVKEAAKATKKTSSNKIIRAIKANRVCGGYKWSYTQSDKYIPFNAPRISKCGQYDLEGNLIKIWPSASQCRKVYPECVQVCKGELESSEGYIFKFISQ